MKLPVFNDVSKVSRVSERIENGDVVINVIYGKDMDTYMYDFSYAWNDSKSDYNSLIRDMSAFGVRYSDVVEAFEKFLLTIPKPPKKTKKKVE